MGDPSREMYDDNQHVSDTFTESNLSEHLLQAQWAEFIELKKILDEHYKRKQSPLRVLDIDIGNARILRHLVPLREIWNTVAAYDGIDIAQNSIDLSETAIAELAIQDKATAKLLDAQNLQELKAGYDLIISTWFTAGNFYPDEFCASTYGQDAPRLDMSKNPKFTSIFSKAYELLAPEGEAVIGSIYIDTEETRIKQEDAYRKFGWNVITDGRDCFTATENGWWSQRFTKQRVREYLSFVDRKNISFVPLDTYDYAMMVRIKNDQHHAYELAGS